jgi:hypothetical protein
MKRILAIVLSFGLVVSGVALAVVQARYARVLVGTDATIQDLSTGLEWMQDTGSPSGRMWKEALAYCEDLSHAGYDNWRLPNVTELASLIDEKQPPNQPPINRAYFTDFVEGPYWTSTTLATEPPPPPDPDMAFVVRFDGGSDPEFRWGGVMVFAKNSYQAYVMCVRDFQ